ncbi:hypothetical protein [Vampirovibrio chlorellavorus]|uniref:hypothetical protein n=1 Tax=Vampirovibrio chlorellavorus TaxID=758823 RepID=UPI0026E9CE6F|nr:hypothetical protein [Vampirovibrio chlorellavorus]
MKSQNGKWAELFNFDDDVLDDSLGLGDEAEEGILFLEEAHEALNKLSQKANTRGKLMRQPRKAESWH